MFNPSILELESQIQYHQEQQELAEQELDRLKMTQAFAEDAAEKIEDALEHIDPKYIDIFKEHLLTLFPTEAPLSSEMEAPVYLEEKVEEVIEPQEEKPKKEFDPLSYYELTGKPDLRPDTFEDLAPNITYSSSGRAYIGFNDKQEAEKFRDSISEPSMLSYTDTMNGYKYEVKFYCTKEFIEDIVNDWTPDQKAELDWQEQLVRIAPDIFYDPSTSRCFVGFTNYQRANTYGAHLKEIHELYDSRYTVGKPSVVTNCKHELVIKCITEENARKLSGLNLKKELEHKTNKAITDKWSVLTEDVHIYVPQTQEIKKSQVLGESDFPSYPYTEIPLDQVEFGDVITSTSHSRSAYMVKEHKGEFVLAECLYHKSLPSRVGEEYSFSKIYLVEKVSSGTKESTLVSTEEIASAALLRRDDAAV
ncbi:MAG: hypothetical protein AAGE84_06825 [Cyanobacteria bacterium P01_G01_bin.39]